MSFDPNNMPIPLSPSGLPVYATQFAGLDAGNAHLTGPYGQPVLVSPNVQLTPAMPTPLTPQPSFGSIRSRSPSPAPLDRTKATLEMVIERTEHLSRSVRRLKDENHTLRNDLIKYQNHCTDLHTQLMLATPKSAWEGGQLEYASARFIKYWPKDGGKIGLIAKCTTCNTQRDVFECDVCHKVRCKYKSFC
jgi:hypothetical protein